MKKISEHRVAASMTDPQAELSVIGIFQLAEDAATELMGELSLDNITMKHRYHAAWVFAKNRVRRLRGIGWNKPFTAACFFSSVTPATANLDVELRDGEGALCACSRIQLCALDRETGRLLRLSSFGFGGGALTEAPACDLRFTRFGAEELPRVGQVRIGYTNIDFLRHTNNVEYVRFMLNAYSVQELERRPVREMEIAYVGQSFEGDLLTLKKGSFGDRDLFSLSREDKPVARGEILF